MAGPKIVVFDTRKLRKAHAQAPQVEAKVHEVTERIGATAQALFASHDRPGGHRITTEYHSPDGYVVLSGPAPVALEQGHWTHSDISADRTFVRGLHILPRSIGSAGSV